MRLTEHCLERLEERYPFFFPDGKPDHELLNSFVTALEYAVKDDYGLIEDGLLLNRRIYEVKIDTFRDRKGKLTIKTRTVYALVNRTTDCCITVLTHA